MKTFPHTDLTAVQIRVPDRILGRFPIETMSPDYPKAMWMPQPIFLEALHQKAKAFPSFDLWFGASASQLLQTDGKTIGVIAKRGDEEIAVHAKVTVGCDGRTSRLRHVGGFELEMEEYRFDILWFSLPRPEGYEPTVQAMFSEGRPYIIAPKHPDLIQCGLLTQPGEFAQFRKQGLEPLKKILMAGPPEFQKFASELQDFKPFFPLQARIERVKDWAKDGLVLIGDAAHTCSPMGAIGVSIAVESAAIAAQVICDCLAKNDFSAEALSEIQQLREEEVITVQGLQSRMGSAFRARNKFLQKMMPYLVNIFVNMGMPQKVLKRIITSEKPLPIDAKFGFD